MKKGKRGCLVHSKINSKDLISADIAHIPAVSGLTFDGGCMQCIRKKKSKFIFVCTRLDPSSLLEERSKTPIVFVVFFVLSATPPKWGKHPRYIIII